MIKNIIEFILMPYTRWQQHREFKRRLEELRKRDPFIYK
jgi:hypothetical protein